jgi:hypothetical protein
MQSGRQRPSKKEGVEMAKRATWAGGATSAIHETNVEEAIINNWEANSVRKEEVRLSKEVTARQAGRFALTRQTRFRYNSSWRRGWQTLPDLNTQIFAICSRAGVGYTAGVVATTPHVLKSRNRLHP